MRLSETGLTVLRDGTFESLGTVTHDRAMMLVFLESPKFLPGLLDNKHITAVITSPELATRLPESLGVAVAEDPRRAFFLLHNELAQAGFYRRDGPTSISDTAIVHPTAVISETGVTMGPGTRIEANAVVLPGSVIGADTVIGPGVVVGGAGFEFKRLGAEILRVEHAGGVRIGDRVEVQANSCVDRSVFGGFTEIGDDTKIDNLVHVAHNATIGRRCLIAASAMIAGSTAIGDDVWIGPGACVSSEVSLGDRASVTIGAVVIRDVPADGRVTGNFAFEHRSFMRAWARWQQE